LIGISSPNFSFSPFNEVLERIRKHFDLWEIISDLEHDLSKLEGDISYAMDSYGIKFQVHAPIADLNIGSPAARSRKFSLDEILGLIDTCERLSIETLTIHPGAAIAYGDEVKERVRNATKESLKAIDRKIIGMSLKVALENMPPASWSIGYDLKELLSMIDGTNIGICFDTGHANIAGSIDGFLRENRRLANVHLHNNDKSFDQHMPLDSGSLDIESIVVALRKFYSGNYIIEARDLDEGIHSKKCLEKWLER
jgi:sugar phosphate isomerase/epimerase